MSSEGGGLRLRGQLDDDVGGLHRGNGEDAGCKSELVGRLAAHQRHDPVGAGLHLDLGHHRVLDDLGHEPFEAIARRLRHDGRRAAIQSDLSRQGRQPGPFDQAMPTLGADGLQPAGDNEWSGAIYNADDGKSYAVNVKLVSSKKMALKGWILGVLCKSQTWTRVE